MPAKTSQLIIPFSVSGQRCRQNMILLAIALNINIALQLGDWDRFSVIIEDALKRLEKLGRHVLIRLASLAAEAQPTQAIAATPTPAIVVQAPGVSVRVGTIGSGYIIQPRQYGMVPGAVLVPRTVLVPAQPVITRQRYWTPVRDFLWGRHRLHYVPIH